ncbi:unnamed protein product [Fusarium venenatum]|uniref:Uncharacterized protein n=1 Tax=Fusarium venenatum TaxID=56646 RepID=A0A2L2TPP2_9HYPO|nr:uncharacterized protein FVRRES_07126 [Fusarium venenatum]CEI62690.1 unnamed protein product [Fusarium venenatum]
MSVLDLLLKQLGIDYTALSMDQGVLDRMIDFLSIDRGVRVRCSTTNNRNLHGLFWRVTMDSRTVDRAVDQVLVRKVICIKWNMCCASSRTSTKTATFSHELPKRHNKIVYVRATVQSLGSALSGCDICITTRPPKISTTCQMVPDRLHLVKE